MSEELVFEHKPPETAIFTRRVGSFTLGTIISRITGLVRESIFAYLFGVGRSTDAFNLAFRVPNLVRDLFAESALSAAFVPTFVQNLKTRERKAVWRFASNVFNTMLVFIGLLVILGIVFAPWVVKLLGLGFVETQGKLELATTLTRIILPFLLFVSLAAWAMGILNSFGSFFVPAIAPAFFNIFSILVPIFTYPLLTKKGVDPIIGMALGLFLGAIVQFLIQLPYLIRRGFRYSFYLNLSDPELRKVLLLWLPTILGFASFPINFAINTFLITFLEEKSLTYLNYAYRIMHLPAGLFGVAIGSVAIAELSRTVNIRAKLRHALTLVSVLTIPTAIFILILARPIVSLIYEHGKFTSEDTIYTAQALMLYILGVPFSAGVRSVAAGFYSLKDTKTPAIVGFLIVVLNTALNLSLMGALRFLAFPLATSTCALVNFIVLTYLLSKKIGSLEIKKISEIVIKITVISLIAGLIVSLLYSKFALLNSGLRFALSGISGLIIFYLLSYPLELKEVRDIFANLVKKTKS